MSKFADVESRAKSDPAFLGQLLVSPKNALAHHGITLDDEADAKQLESFVRSAQAHVATAGALAGFAVHPDDWGIGFTCCNTQPVTK